jgi:hypothetical protein
VPDSEGDGRYSYQKPWELTSQTLEMQRRQTADAAPPWYPAIVPQPDPAEMVPPMYGYRTEELGIDDILDGVYTRLQGSAVRDNALLDWSGEQGSYEGTMRPTGAGGSGIV